MGEVCGGEMMPRMAMSSYDHGRTASSPAPLSHAHVRGGGPRAEWAAGSVSEAPPYQRNDYIGWITSAKREATRKSVCGKCSMS